MTPLILKEQLIFEHKRDRKLTIIAFCLAFIPIAIAGMFLAFFLSETFGNPNSDNSQNFSPFLMICLALPILGIGYVTYRFYIIGQRAKKIDQLISSLESGEIATEIDEETVYKFTIPLIKINLKLKPIQYVRIRFSGKKNKRYFLPIPFEAIQDFKAVLSGVNMMEINEAWYELYEGKSGNTQQNEIKALPTKDAFENFVENDLSDEIESIENVRKKSYKKQIIITVVFSIIGVASWLGFQFFLPKTGNLMDNISISPTYLILGGFAVYGVIMFFVKQNNNNISTPGEEVNHQFKIRIFKRMIAFINPAFKYVLHGHIGLGELQETGILSQKAYTIQGNDQIMGNHNGVPFQLCDLNVTYKANFSEEKETPDVVIMGQVFVAQFNKRLSHELYVVPKKTKGLFKNKPVINEYLGVLGEKVILEDPDFMERYDVYSTDQIEARYVMSPALMERIKKIDKEESSLYISFRNNRISIINNNNKNNFETSIGMSLTKDVSMTRFYEELTEQLSIIDNLKLNVKIWK